MKPSALYERCLSKLKIGDIVDIYVKPYEGRYRVSTEITKDIRPTTLIGKTKSNILILGSETNEFGFWKITEHNSAWHPKLDDLGKILYGWMLYDYETRVAKITLT